MSKELRLPFLVTGGYYLLGFSLRPLDLDPSVNEVLATILRIILSIVLWKYVGNRIKEEYVKNNWIVGPVVGLLVIGTIYQKFGPGSEQSFSFFSWEHLLYSVSKTSTGIFEELVCRAALFFAVLKQVGEKQIWKAVVVTSLIFAIMHFPNMLRPEGVNFSVISQIIYAFGVGLLLQSLFVRLKNLLLVVVLHSLANYWMGFSGIFETPVSSEQHFLSFSEAWGNAVNLLVFVLLLCLPLSYVILKGGSRKL